MVKVPTGDFDPTKSSQGGFALPGKCHLLVTEVTDCVDEKGYIDVSCEVIAHEKKESVGKNTKLFLSVNEKQGNRKRLVSFGLAVGLLTLEDCANANAEGGEFELSYDENDAVGRTFCTVIETREGTNKTQIGFTFVNPQTDEAEKYPRAMEYVMPKNKTNARTAKPRPVAAAAVAASKSYESIDDMPF